MPTYAYRCTECGTAFDVHQEFSDNSLTECPNCGGKLRKLFGTVGVTFNGSGFYRNDSRASAEKASGGGDKGSSSGGESGASSDSDPRPEPVRVSGGDTVFLSGAVIDPDGVAI